MSLVRYAISKNSYSKTVVTGRHQSKPTPVSVVATAAAAAIIVMRLASRQPLHLKC
jgi:hypothetical protein